MELLRSDLKSGHFKVSFGRLWHDLVIIANTNRWSLCNGMEEFVKDLLKKSDPQQKLKMCEKILQLNKLCQISKKQEEKLILSKINVAGKVPAEIWLKIISYLKCKDVFLGFGQVCKRFNNLIHDPTAIKSVEFDRMSTYEKTDTVLEILKYSKSLKSIVLPRYVQQELLIKQALISSPKLKSVSLFGKWLDIDSKMRTVESLKKARNIEHLNFLGSYELKLNNEILLQIADMKTLKSLKLSIYNNFKVDPEFLIKIASNINKLETIELSNCAMNDTQRRQEAFDIFFKKEKNTLKNLDKTLNMIFGTSKINFCSKSSMN